VERDLSSTHGKRRWFYDEAMPVLLSAFILPRLSLKCTSTRVSDQYPIHADPDLGLQIFADPDKDPKFEIFADLDPSLVFFLLVVFT